MPENLHYDLAERLKLLGRVARFRQILAGMDTEDFIVMLSDYRHQGDIISYRDAYLHEAETRILDAEGDLPRKINFVRSEIESVLVEGSFEKAKERLEFIIEKLDDPDFWKTKTKGESPR